MAESFLEARCYLRHGNKVPPEHVSESKIFRLPHNPHMSCITPSRDQEERNSRIDPLLDLTLSGCDGKSHSVTRKVTPSQHGYRADSAEPIEVTQD